MRFKIVSVGRERADPAAPLVEDYVRRIGKFIPVETHVIRSGDERKTSDQLLGFAAKSSLVVALDERGVEYHSRAFAKLVSDWMNRGLSSVTFLLGGADGLPQAVRKRADLLLALTKMTLPHRLARLILMEQLYRALSIVRGLPYQK